MINYVIYFDASQGLLWNRDWAQYVILKFRWQFCFYTRRNPEIHICTYNHTLQATSNRIKGNPVMKAWLFFNNCWFSLLSCSDGLNTFFTLQTPEADSFWLEVSILESLSYTAIEILVCLARSIFGNKSKKLSFSKT